MTEATGAGRSRPLAFVTGGGRRVGLSICTRLLHEGWAVAATSHAPSDALRALKDGPHGDALTIVPADLSTPDGAARTAAAVAETCPRLDMMVLNAGILEIEPMAAVDPDGALRQFTVNALANAVLVDRLRDRLAPDAAIIAVTDACLTAPTPDNAGYVMSKAALNALVDVWALALAPVRVHAVAPAYLAPYPGEGEPERARRAGALLLGGPPDLTALCDAVLYLYGARSVTGSRLTLDGGLRLKPYPRDFTFTDIPPTGP